MLSSCRWTSIDGCFAPSASSWSCSAWCSPSSLASPPVISTTPVAPIDWSSRAKRNAMLAWIPRRMLGALTPCETMLNP